MSENQHLHAQADGESRLLESEGGQSMRPPPLQLTANPLNPPDGGNHLENANTPLQMQEEETGGDGFEAYEALGVARDAPADGEEAEDSGGVNS